MWDGLQIGIGEKANITVATKIRGIDVYISENSKEYWIDNNDNFLDIEMKIAKNTKEGKRLDGLIKDGNTNKINEFLARIVCNNLSTEKLIKAIKKSNKKYFEKGEKQAQKEMRRALGITRFSQD